MKSWHLKLLERTNSNVPQPSINLDDWREQFYAGHTGDNTDTKKKHSQGRDKVL